MKKKPLVILLIISLLLCASCSRFVYNRADWLAAWYVDDYIDFNRSQKKQFKRLVREQHQWHRATELPRYKQFLQTQQQVFAKKDRQITPQYMESITDTFLAFWDDFMVEVLPKMAQVLSQLSDKQVSELIQELESEQQEMQKKAKDETQEQIVAEREKEMQASIKRWFGKLEKNQKQQVAQWARSLTPVYIEALKQRKQWVEKLAHALGNRTNQTALLAQLKLLFIEPDALWPEPYRHKMEQNSQKTYALLAKVSESATSKQLVHLDKTLSGYIKDLDKLHKN